MSFAALVLVLRILGCQIIDLDRLRLINYLTLNISSSVKSNMPALSDRYLLMSLLMQQNLRAYCPRCKAAIRVLNELVCYG